MKPITDLIKCVEREIAMRKNVYAKRVNAGAMKYETAMHEVECMETVSLILERVKLQGIGPEGWRP